MAAAAAVLFPPYSSQTWPFFHAATGFTLRITSANPTEDLPVVSIAEVL